MKQNEKPDAFHIMKRLKRVLDSCVTEEQKAVAEKYKMLALKRYDWEKYSDIVCRGLLIGDIFGFHDFEGQVQNTGVRVEKKVDYDIIVTQTGVGEYEIDTMPCMKNVAPEIYYMNRQREITGTDYV